MNNGERLWSLVFWLPRFKVLQDLLQLLSMSASELPDGLPQLIEVFFWAGVKLSASSMAVRSFTPPLPSANGSLKLSGFGSNSQAKDAVKVGFDYFKANATHVSASIKSLDHDYHLHVVELHNTGPTAAMTLTTFIALCSAVLGKPIQS